MRSHDLTWLQFQDLKRKYNGKILRITGVKRILCKLLGVVLFDYCIYSTKRLRYLQDLTLLNQWVAKLGNRSKAGLGVWENVWEMTGISRLRSVGIVLISN